MKRRKITKIKIKLNKKSKDIIKSFFLLLLVVSGFEITLLILEKGEILPEPYDYGAYQDIPFKFNEAQSLFSQNPDKIKIAILGDSRPRCGIDPHYIDEYFDNKTITYNLGIRGINFKVHYFMLEYLVLNRLHPDIILWDIQQFDFIYSERDEDIMSLPIVGYHIIGYTPRIYRYRSLFTPSFLNLTADANAIKTRLSKEYERGYFQWEYTNYTSPYSSMTVVQVDINIDASYKEAFFKSVNALENSGTPYLVLQGPYDCIRYENDEALSQFGLVQNQYWIDMNGNEDLMDETFYYNPLHLCHEGAEKYTQFICEALDDRNMVPKK
ncbi:MAG: hypothetical protein ACFFCS_12420 [Candidatus Hodarchaeota archaeon]